MNHETQEAIHRLYYGVSYTLKATKELIDPSKVRVSQYGDMYYAKEDWSKETGKITEILPSELNIKKELGV